MTKKLDTPGLDGSNAFTAVDILQQPEKAGQQVAVIGGGLAGCETALWPAQNFHKLKS